MFDYLVIFQFFKFQTEFQDTGFDGTSNTMEASTIMSSNTADTSSQPADEATNMSVNVSTNVSTNDTLPELNFSPTTKYLEKSTRSNFTFKLSRKYLGICLYSNLQIHFKKLP